MDPIPKSGLYYPNRFVRIALLALEELMGKYGIDAILNMADKPFLIDHYPPDNLEREFDFSDFSTINGTIDEMYGQRGGRGLTNRTGKMIFSKGLKNFGAMAGVIDKAFIEIPLQTKLRIGIPAIAKIITQISDQYTTVEEKEEHFIYTVHKCPICWGRKVKHPADFLMTGILEEGLKYISGGDNFRVDQSRSKAVGDEVCEFIIHKEPRIEKFIGKSGAS